MKLRFSKQIFEKYSYIKFYENSFNMTKQTVALRDFANAPKNDSRYECIYSEHPPNNTVFVPCYRRGACQWLHSQPQCYSWFWQWSWLPWRYSRHMLGLWWDPPCSCLLQCVATVLARRHTGSAQPCILIPSAQSQMDMTLLLLYV